LDLFDYNSNTTKKESPLADRMRPEKVNDIKGQGHILGPGKIINRLVDSDRLTSMIFYGPSGTGKTTIAMAIANTTGADFNKINAVVSGIQDIKKIIQKAEDNKKYYNKKTILFIDEIHRFNKSQQDALLPSVETGLLILIGATTENPYFSINSALLSRANIFQIKKLEDNDLMNILGEAVKDEDKGLGSYNINISKEALEHFVKFASGDARKALNALEIAVLSTSPDEKGLRKITLEIAEDSVQRPAISYDKSGDQHYDVISAFIKSMRGSDPDAGIYYLALMLEAGEDPLFIARRILIFASEDIGLADSNALTVALSAYQSVERLGMPEGRIILSHAVLYCALAPKNNDAYASIDYALSRVKKGEIYPVPIHLKDSHYAGASKLGSGIEYKYPHNYPGNWVEQDYLPEKLKGEKFYKRKE